MIALERNLADPFAHVRGWLIPDQLKYFQARYAYKHASELLPGGDGYKLSRRGNAITWRQWWERRHKQRLDDYIDQVQTSARPQKT